jgi:hypothetical protein
MADIPFELKINKSQFEKLAKDLPGRHQKAMGSVLSSVSNELRKQAAAYARSASFGTPSPLAVATRKQFKKGYGPWVAAFTRYSVNRKTLFAQVGLLSATDTGSQYLDEGRTARVISRGFAAAARKLAKGGIITITKKKQIGIARALIKDYGASMRLTALSYLIPRVGPHTLRARPVFGPFGRSKRDWAVRKMAELYRVKMEGGRYSKSWASE